MTLGDGGAVGVDPLALDAALLGVLDERLEPLTHLGERLEDRRRAHARWGGRRLSDLLETASPAAVADPKLWAILGGARAGHTLERPKSRGLARKKLWGRGGGKTVVQTQGPFYHHPGWW